ncbi:MAG: hypothetical protein E7317_00560 [Clostridiales bacterium]|nr:hypothetical protein [Clostridiales bacterium]
MNRTICLLLTLLMAVTAGAEGTRDDMRAAWRAIRSIGTDAPFTAEPRAVPPLEAGALSDAALDGAVDTVNFLRGLAGLSPVSLSPIYTLECQHGATLLACLDYAAHDVPQPEGVDAEFYRTAVQATRGSNVAKFNWTRPTMLEEAVLYFARDDGDLNLTELGHRRWLLDPAMRETGFGMAVSGSGSSYALMYAVDHAGDGGAWDHVAWPSAGVFPAELMHGHLPWSVSLNEDVYDVAGSSITVTLSEESLGLIFSFDCTAGKGDGECAVSFDRCGSGPAVIFRPGFTGTAFSDYLQNQVWTVRLEGLKDLEGREATIEYAVQMASLYVQEAASVDMSVNELSLVPGERAALSAQVVPDYADDLALTWHSSDEAVVRVYADGTVEAVAPGTASVTAESANGRSDACLVTVREG